MEEAIAEFDKQETARLASGMAPKEITVCQDETFHPEPCLVAIEPESNFIKQERGRLEQSHVGCRPGYSCRNSSVYK